jgi:hypothetical protein
MSAHRRELDAREVPRLPEHRASEGQASPALEPAKPRRSCTADAQRGHTAASRWCAHGVRVPCGACS